MCGRGDAPFPIVLSPRTRQTAARLQAAYPSRVRVADSMQAVLDQSEWVVLAVPPDQGEAVCRSLRFRADHKVISFLPDKSLPQLRDWIGETAMLVHMVPLTFNALCDGPVPAVPAAVRSGRPVRLHRPRDRGGQSGEDVRSVRDHGMCDPAVRGDGYADRLAEEKGVSDAQAVSYVTGFFDAVCTEAIALDPAGVHRMARESTPGGINLMAKDILEKAGGFAAWDMAMEQVLARVAEAPAHG